MEEYKRLGPTYDPDPLVTARSPEEVRRLLRVDEKRAFLRPFVSALKGPIEFLDIGCGQGGYLLAARELGCSILGVEPSADHSTVGREVFGLPIVHDTFDASAFSPSRFHLVLLSHVIEHIYDPAAFLGGVGRVIAPGGLLVVVTPNADSTVARWSGPYWTMLKTPDHVSLLSARTFRKLGIPPDHRVRFRQSEYPWETPVSLALAVRDAVRERRARDARGPGLSTTQRTAKHQRVQWLLRWLSVAALPIYTFNRLGNRQACLIAEIRKPEA